MIHWTWLLVAFFAGWLVSAALILIELRARR
jgi:hypothetical protein